ncbi:MAG: MFS transporter [Thermodesulfobacteriota bacterium]
MDRQISLSICIRFLIYFVHWMVLAHLPILLKQQGFDDVAVGLVVGIFALSSMLLMLPMGLFSDFFSPKRTLLTGALCFALYFLLLPRAVTLHGLIPVTVLGGLGAAALIVVSESLYLKQFGQEQRGRRVALYHLSTYLGFGLGPLAGSFLVPQGLLFAAAGAGALVIFAVSLGLHDHPVRIFAFRDYGDDLRHFKPLMLMACIFMLGTHFGVEQTSISLLMRETLHFTPERIGLYFAVVGLWMAAVVPVVGHLHDKRSSVFLFFLAGLGLSALFQALTAFATGFWSLLAIRLLHTLGDAVALLEFSVLTTLFFPSRRLGGNSGVLYAVRTLATFSAAVLTGVVNRHWSYGASFLGSGLVVLLFVGGSFLLIALRPALRQEVGWGRN